MFQISDVLKKVPFFRTLGKEGIDFIVERLKFKPFETDEVICHIGDPGDKMYIIISGRVKVVVKTEESDEETIIAYLGGGDYFGEMALLTGEPRSASVITTDSSEMFILNKADFDIIVERFPSITLSMGKIMSQRLRDTLQKAAKTGGGEVSSTVQGNLSEKSLVEILKFCESNSLNGKLIVTSGEERGFIYYTKGELQKVELGQINDDEALDTMLNWTVGSFLIEPEPLRLEKELTEEKVDSVSESIQLIIINNSLVVQKMLQRTFENIGYTVYTVENKKKGLNLIDKLKPDVIVADTKLPDSDGEDLVKSIRNIDQSSIVLLTEERNREKYMEKLSNIKNIQFTKSQDIGEILHSVQQVLGR
jgi:CRP-like cAMP-binding protein/CheY-like chemotaxis protein